MIAVATVKTVLENPQYVRNVSDSKNESLFRVKIAHLRITLLLSMNIRFWQRREAIEYINRSNLRTMRERTARRREWYRHFNSAVLIDAAEGLLSAVTVLAFIDDLNIVAVRIKHPGRIIAGIVFETSLR
jgi:hypothetical protein